MQIRLKSLYATLCLALAANGTMDHAALPFSLGAPEALAQGDVALSAKKAPKGAANRANGGKGNKGDKGQRTAAPLPVNGKFPQLFFAPSQPPAWMAGDFVGRDATLTG